MTISRHQEVDQARPEDYVVLAYACDARQLLRLLEHRGDEGVDAPGDADRDDDGVVALASEVTVASGERLAYVAVKRRYLTRGPAGRWICRREAPYTMLHHGGAVLR